MRFCDGLILPRLVDLRMWNSRLVPEKGRTRASSRRPTSTPEPLLIQLRPDRVGLSTKPLRVARTDRVGDSLEQRPDLARNQKRLIGLVILWKHDLNLLHEFGQEAGLASRGGGVRFGDATAQLMSAEWETSLS